MVSDKLVKFTKKIAAYPMSLFFYLYISTFLIYLPSNPALTRSFRLLALVGVFCVALSVSSMRKELFDNIKSFSGLTKLLVLIIIGAIVWSSLGPLSFDNRLFIGSSPEYLGTVTWLLFIGLGALFMKYVRLHLLSRGVALVFVASIAVSLLANSFYIRQGFRMAGVMFQPTTMGMYGIIAALVSAYLLIKQTKPHVLFYVSFALSVLTVLLSQSRIAYVTLAVLLSVCSLYYFNKRKKMALGAAAIVVFIAIIPQVSQNYFSRFQSDSVQKGLTYRLDLYKVAGKDVLLNNPIKGNGPDSLPLAINNTNLVPEEIAKSLSLGWRFLSAHDLFFDMAYFFGCVAAIATLILTALAIKQTSVHLTEKNLFLLMIFAVLLINALFNVPSLELTSLYFVMMFGLLNHEKTA